MSFEQVIFRIEIDHSESTLVHVIHDGGESVSVKVDDILMSVSEFSEWVNELVKIRNKIGVITAFARELDE